MSVCKACNTNNENGRFVCKQCGRFLSCIEPLTENIAYLSEVEFLEVFEGIEQYSLAQQDKRSLLLAAETYGDQMNDISNLVESVAWFIYDDGSYCAVTREWKDQEFLQWYVDHQDQDAQDGLTYREYDGIMGPERFEEFLKLVILALAQKINSEIYDDVFCDADWNIEIYGNNKLLCNIDNAPQDTPKKVLDFLGGLLRS